MPYIDVCRVCLANNTRMYLLNPYLLEIFEKLTNITITPEDCKPGMVCYICHYHLVKCQILARKAIRADKLLNEVLSAGLVIDQNCFAISERDQLKLSGGLCISPVECVELNENDVNFDLDSAQEKRVGETDVKEELKEEPKERIQVPDDKDDLSNHVYSDSDDDIPLKAIITKKNIAREAKRIRGRRKEPLEKNYERRAEEKIKKVPISEYAREIILTKEQQMEELLARSKSLNYMNSPLKCDHCYKGFVDVKAFSNHMAKHDETSGAHACDVCRMRYRSARLLRTHAAAAHGRHYVCVHCGHTSHTANQAREHEQWHSGYTYECKLCSRKFRKPTSYLTHMRKFHSTQHVCTTCGDSFATKHGILMHTSKSHRHHDKVTENSSEPASKRYCTDCNIQFLTIEAWRRHILISVVHKHTSIDNSLQCKVCDLVFVSPSLLRSHLRDHERALKPPRVAPQDKLVALLTCEQCGARFADNSKLHAHVKRIHLGLKYNKNIVCEVCGKKCPSNAALKYHQRRHTGEKPFHCTVCTKRFSNRHQMVIHSRTHTGERPYCCTSCGKRFSQKPALNRHVRIHTGVKPYICQYCSKTFSQSNSLKIHVNTIHLKIPHVRKQKKKNGPDQDVKLEENFAMQKL